MALLMVLAACVSAVSTLAAPVGSTLARSSPVISSPALVAPLSRTAASASSPNAPARVTVAQEATIWRELAAIGALERNSRDRSTRIAALRASSPGRDRTAVGALVRAKLDALSGAPVELKWDLSGPWPYDREASWVAAELLPRGPTRSRAIIAALGSLDDAQRDPPLAGAQAELAYEVWVDAADHLRLGEALAIGRNLHARSHATWSAVSLALTTMRAGLPEECDAVLAAQIALTPNDSSDLAVLWDHRGIAAIGAGWEQPGRFALGRAVLHGSTDGAVVLARLDLAAGKLESARTGFRAALLENPDSDWARRGWGLSLLPPKSGSDEHQATSW